MGTHPVQSMTIQLLLQVEAARGEGGGPVSVPACCNPAVLLSSASQNSADTPSSTSTNPSPSVPPTSPNSTRLRGVQPRAFRS